jgi:hypothetical protein
LSSDSGGDVESLPELTKRVDLFVAFPAVHIGDPSGRQEHVVAGSFIESQWVAHE